MLKKTPKMWYNTIKINCKIYPVKEALTAMGRRRGKYYVYSCNLQNKKFLFWKNAGL